MKINISTNEACSLIYRDTNSCYSSEACRAIVEDLETMEEEAGEDYIFDLPSIRGAYDEHDDLLSWVIDYTGKPDLQGALDQLGVAINAPISGKYLEDYIEREGIGRIIKFDGGFLLSHN